MKVFICGGGSEGQTVQAVQRLNEVIRHDLPCLYIPLAMEEDQYHSLGDHAHFTSSGRYGTLAKKQGGPL